MTWTLKRKILLERGKALASGSGWDEVPQEPSPLPRGTQGGRRRFPPGTIVIARAGCDCQEKRQKLQRVIISQKCFN